MVLRTKEKAKEENGVEIQINEKELDKCLLEWARNKRKESGYNGYGVVKSLIQKTCQSLLESEMDDHLGYEKYSREGQGNGNARNGHTEKTIRGELGELEILTPRDRKSEFEPEIIKKREKNVGMFEDKILSLYTRGMTTREIQEHLQEIYGIEVSPTFISNATSRVEELLRAWQDRQLDSLYPVIYLDGIRYKVRGEDNKVVNKVVYICLGVDLEGKQDVLGLWISEAEGAAFWLNVCNELKSRGVQDILIACVDGLTGLPDAIEAVFPKVDVQLCVVHMIRNSTQFLSYNNRKSFCADLRRIYTAPSREAAEHGLELLEQKWGKKYPSAIKPWKTHWERIITFLKYPLELRTMIYTTNSIEALNRQLRKNTKNRSVFPNDTSLRKLLYLNIQNIRKRKIGPRKDWKIIVNQLLLLFGDRIEPHAMAA